MSKARSIIEQVLLDDTYIHDVAYDFVEREYGPYSFHERWPVEQDKIAKVTKWLEDINESGVNPDAVISELDRIVANGRWSSFYSRYDLNKAKNDAAASKDQE